MFRKWQSQKNSRAGMFESWDLDQMLYHHRTRMATMIREGKPPDDTLQVLIRSTSFNPYVDGEFGGGDHQVLLKDTLENAVLTESKEQNYQGPTDTVPPKGFGKVKNGTIYSTWRKSVPEEPGLYGKWLSEQNDPSKPPDIAKMKTGENTIDLKALSQEEVVISMLNGNIYASIGVRQPAIHLFVSTTFSDTKAERRVLMEEVFPRIRDLCRNHGIDFMAVDLGWGQADASFDDPSFSQICMKEMQRCKELSVEGVPSVLHLITNKYGVPGLPEYLDVYEYGYLISLIRDENDRKHVKELYTLDENSVPPAYRIRRNDPMDKLFTSVDKHERRAVSTKWNTKEAEVLGIMRKAVSQVYGFKRERIQKWQSSPLDEQISFSSCDTFAADDALCIFREIPQLHQVTLHENTMGKNILPHYIDLDPERPVCNTGAKKSLESLKKKLKDKFKYKKYVISWNIFGIHETTHADYLSHFAASIFKRMKAKILSMTKKMEGLDDIVAEIANHSRYCIEKSKGFLDRDDQIRKADDHLTNGKNCPLIIFGHPGSGKTSLLSTVAMRFTDLEIRKSDQAVIITRFCGLQKDWSEKCLLISLCEQISRAYSDELMIEASQQGFHEDNASYGDILINMLSIASKEKPLFIFLDALDTIPDLEPAKWLPIQTPPFVNIILSIQKNSRDIFSDWMSIESTIEINPPIKEDVRSTFEQWLAEKHRTLQPDQSNELLSTAVDQSGSCYNFYYLRLIFELSYNIASYDKLMLPIKNADNLLTLYLRKLEDDHGKSFVAHFLSLLILSQCGLSYQHLLDILSTDEDCLESVLLVNPPPMRRFPQSAISKLCHDLGHHIAQSQNYGYDVMIIDDNILASAVTRRYIGNETHLKERYYSLITDYFLGISHEKFTGRLLEPQPLFFQNPRNGNLIFNKAKLLQLPRTSVFSRTPDVACSLLTNLSFITAKCSVGMLDHLCGDYHMVCSVYPDNICLAAFLSFVKNYGAEIANNPETVLKRALEMPHDSPVYKSARDITEKPRSEKPWFSNLSQINHQKGIILPYEFPSNIDHNFSNKSKDSKINVKI